MLNTCMADRSRSAGAFLRRASTAATRVATLVALRGAIERARAGGGPQAVEASRCGSTGMPPTTTAATWTRRSVSEYAEQRDPVERLAERLRLDGLSDERGRGAARRRGRRGRAGLEAAEASPAPDPATILDGVYATKLT